MLLIDAHVHIYDCFDIDKFFDSAYANFKSVAERFNHSNDFTGVLLLAETSKENWFKHFADFADGIDLPEGKNPGNWTFRRTNENNSLIVESGASRILILVAGRQIVTGEGLEVLALFSTASFKDGNSIKNLIENIKDKDGIPVIPWGFDKWTGRRGYILIRMLEGATNSDFYLGDNGNRPFFLPMPSQFKLAQKRNILNLPGSDPLPFASEVSRAGCFGSFMQNDFSEAKPAEYLKNTLRNPDRAFRNYGKLERSYRFFRNQIASQIRKRLKG
jgi:hypothetical protein